MAKKKKLKKRLLNAAAASNVSSIMAAVQTVKSHHAVEPQAPQMPAPAAALVPPPPAPVPAVNLDSWDEDEDEDEDEEESGASLTDSNAVETVITIHHDAIENETAQVDQQQIAEDRNIVSPTEVTKENESMMVVNHPAVAAAPAQQTLPQSAPVVTEHTNLVAEGAMEQMQHAAASTPPAPVAVNPNPAEAAPQVTKEKSVAAFHSLSLTVMFTLDLTNFDHMAGLKKPLSRVALDGQEFNLYSPFRKAGKKADTNPAAEGIVRYALSNTLDITDAVNNSRVMIVGDAEESQNYLSSAIATTRKQVRNLFPAKFNSVVAQFEDNENRQTIQLQLSDIVNVRSWTNSSVGNDDEGSDVVATHNAVLNFVVNAGMLYDTDERVNYIDQIEKVLLMLTEKREEANTAMVISIAIDSTTLADPSIREMFGALLDSGYALYSRREMHRLEENDFLPQTVEEIDSQLLPEKADLILVRMVGDEAEEVETEEGAAEEGVEGAGVE